MIILAGSLFGMKACGMFGATGRVGAQKFEILCYGSQFIIFCSLVLYVVFFTLKGYVHPPRLQTTVLLNITIPLIEAYGSGVGN